MYSYRAKYTDKMRHTLVEIQTILVLSWLGPHTHMQCNGLKEQYILIHTCIQGFKVSLQQG